ncbi:MAG TPA: TonB-dependent receptor [Thermoanaerobaculia bacterium]|nr:TonB-dependent receptor [Thermoanaerobaculia bacterium]
MLRNFTRFALLLVLIGSLPVMAQEQTASIQGTVTDQSGAALPGVTVEAVSNKGLRLTSQTDSSGTYRFPAVPPATYTVTATLAGLEPGVVRNMDVRVGATPRADVTLRVAALAEAVTVTADAPLVDVTSSATTIELSSEQFERLPKGRDFSTVITQAASANFETKQGAFGTGGISIDGASGSENVYVVDGVNTTNPQTGVQGKIVVTDFVDVIQVKSAGYQAEFGGAIGGVINVITKTGTNDFRGSLGGQLVNDSWGGSARPTLQVSAANARVHEYVTYDKDDQTVIEPTITLGGPIMRDRVWFFGAYSPSTRDTDRTVTFLDGTTQTINQEFVRQNWAGALSGNIGSKLLFKVSGNNSGFEQTNILPGVNGRGNSNPATYEGQSLDRENWTYSGYADFIASPEWYFSARGGRYFDEVSQGGIPSDPYVWFASGSPSVFPGVDPAIVRPSGFRTLASNSAITADSYTRDNLDFDATWFPTFGGTHQIKGGIQIANLKNNVDSGFQNHVFRTYWDQPGPFGTQQNRGTFGMVGVYVFKTFGAVKSENTGLFIQDSWTMMNDRLTLNLGLRAEEEKVPSYADPSLGLPKHAIQFDYGDKLAPRLGFAYDVFGTGRTKAFGSWGRYYDVTKMEMPRGSFGADKWIWFNFAIENPDWTKWSCSNVGTSASQVPTCTGGLQYVNNVNLRAVNFDLIEPNLKPMESVEFTLGAQHELTRSIALGFRYVNKSLVRTIEDVGVLVQGDDGSASEEYFTANPGFGVASRILAPTCPSCPALPKAERDYQAFELEVTKRFSGNWGAHASYVYSSLEGNYGGLASSDENGRNSPNVNRYFDNLFNSFDAQGNSVVGKLATDRPHVFKAQVTYALQWGTALGLNQYVGSGTPNSTQFFYHGVPFFAYGRGDMGRTPTLKRTDLSVQHGFNVRGRYGLQVGVNVLNVFDSDSAVNVENNFSTTSVNVTDESFFQGFDPLANIGSIESNKNPLYGQAVQFQDPREVRLFAKFTF